MTLILAGFLVILAGSLSAVVVVTGLRRGHRPLWVEVGLAGVLLTNVATTVPPMLGETDGPGPVILSAALAAWSVVLFTFPDGHTAPGWAGWILGVSLALLVGSLVPGAPDAVRGAAFVPAFTVGLVTQVWRYQRRSTVPERQATKWLLVGLVPAAAVFLGIGVIVSTTSVDPGLFDEGWYAALSLAAIWLVPVAGAVGLLVGDRGPIDHWVHAVIVFCGAGLVVVWLYFLALPVVGTTWAAFLAVALVVPLGRLVVRLATSVVYGTDASSAVSVLGQRLETSVSPADVPAVVARTVAEGLALPYAAVRLSGDLAASAGGPPADAAAPALECFPVAYLGSTVGEIVVAPRAADVALTSRDRAAVDRLAAAAGPALHGARTLQELSVAREHLVRTREEERRRLRRDLHDDLAPTLAGLGLRAAAAASLATTANERAERIHADLQEGIQAAIAQVREIAHDLRPPILDDHGLVAAIRARLATEADLALDVEIRTDDLPSPMPAAVELAVLRIVQEAVMNVRRHARATTCRIELSGHGGSLHVEVTDNGCGIAGDHGRGVGLRSIEERATELGGIWTVASRRAGGTTVAVDLPMRTDTTW